VRGSFSACVIATGQFSGKPSRHIAQHLFAAQLGAEFALCNVGVAGR
jgi:hypothetical protein